MALLVHSFSNAIQERIGEEEQVGGDAVDADRGDSVADADVGDEAAVRLVVAVLVLAVEEGCYFAVQAIVARFHISLGYYYS